MCPGASTLAELSGTVSDYAIYAGLAVGGYEARWGGTWELATAVVIATAVRRTAVACGVHVAGGSAEQNPLGSLIYDPSATGVIAPVNDVDSFSINVDPGQTITIVMQSTTLQGTITLLDPSNATIGSATASAVGAALPSRTAPRASAIASRTRSVTAAGPRARFASSSVAWATTRSTLGSARSASSR